MIVVLADDFSGAAEIAGIASRYGLRTILQTDIDLSGNYDVVIVDTNTRSKQEKEAREILKKIARTVSGSQIEWIYKKIDSVLRGHITAEIESLVTELNVNKILIVANNPSSGRVIKEKKYYIDDQKLHETDFRFDPEFPAKSSVVTDILGTSQLLPLFYIHAKDSINGSGIFIPEILQSEDLAKRASELDGETIPVGGSEFFKTLLESRGYKLFKKQSSEEKDQKGKRFFVLASTSQQTRELCISLKKSKVSVCPIPCETLDTSALTDACLRRWVNNIRSAFKENTTVVSAVLHPVNTVSGFPQALNIFISHMIKEIVETIELDKLLVEGGATTSNLVRYLGWRNFTVLKEYSTGVVKLKIEKNPDCKLIVKPGSYQWPAHLHPVPNF